MPVSTERKLKGRIPLSRIAAPGDFALSGAGASLAPKLAF
jgi:hypothetical protein